MNIFVLDESPGTPPLWQCDKHCVKMPLEGAQMLCYATQLRMVGYAGGMPSPAAKRAMLDEIVNLGNVVPYAPNSQHQFHPCTLWAASSEHNWKWLLDHTVAGLSEYTRRYGKTSACNVAVMTTRMVYRRAFGLGDERKHSPWAMAFSEGAKPLIILNGKYSSRERIVDAYRQYYTWKWLSWNRDMRFERAPMRVEEFPWFHREMVDRYQATAG